MSLYRLLRHEEGWVEIQGGRPGEEYVYRGPVWSLDTADPDIDGGVSVRIRPCIHKTKNGWKNVFLTPRDDLFEEFIPRISLVAMFPDSGNEVIIHGDFHEVCGGERLFDAQQIIIYHPTTLPLQELSQIPVESMDSILDRLHKATSTKSRY